MLIHAHAAKLLLVVTRVEERRGGRFIAKIRNFAKTPLEMVHADEPKSPIVSATDPDWSREHRARGEWNPSKALLKSIRDYQRARNRNSALPAKLAVLRHRFWSAVTGADIPLTCKIGGGLLIPHPNGIVVHPDAEIGPNCLLFQQVTIGATQGGVPRLGGHVDVGAGAKLIGPVTIGDDAKIGANAVVTIDVPAGATAVGIPAQIVAVRLGGGQMTTK
jgi:serine O-acetyltransferase